jgi:hypothetical protein
MVNKTLFMGIGVAIGLAVGLVASFYFTSVSVAAATLEAEKKYQETLLQHYVKKDLKTEQLRVILVASPSTVPEPALENIDGFSSVLSKPVQDRLSEFGVSTSHAHPAYVVPTYAAWDAPYDESAHPYPHGDRVIFVIEDKVLRERMYDSEFRQFFKDAATNHSTFIITGSSGLDLLKQLTRETEVQAYNLDTHHGNAPMTGFKITNERAIGGGWIDIAEFGPPVHGLDGNVPHDQALFIVEFARGQSELAKTLISQSLP